MKLWLLLGAINGFLAVGFGAFGAHGLRGKVDDLAYNAFVTGAHYHLLHSVVLLAIAWLSVQIGSITVTAAGWFFTAGIVLFSGSLYVYGITGSKALVMLTPLGGVAFLIGWGCLIALALALGR